MVALISKFLDPVAKRDEKGIKMDGTRTPVKF
jgi:hypothetical protein